jgi:hypothetical protein
LTNVRGRLGFCAAIAVIAASVADPIAEFCSNAGFFGAGSYTDHSNLDVVPALVAGFGLLALYLVRRAPAILAGRALSGGIAGSFGVIFAFQLAALYLMETAEQLLVWGHLLGPTIWLGAPIPIAIAIHALVAFGIVSLVLRSRRALATTTLRVIRLIRAIATFDAAMPQPSAVRRPRRSVLKELILAFRAIGERAPPMRCMSFAHRHKGEFLCYPKGGFAPQS